MDTGEVLVINYFQVQLRHNNNFMLSISSNIAISGFAAGKIRWIVLLDSIYIFCSYS